MTATDQCLKSTGHIETCLDCTQPIRPSCRRAKAQERLIHHMPILASFVVGLGMCLLVTTILSLPP